MTDSLPASGLICGEAALAEALADDYHRPMRELLAYWSARVPTGVPTGAPGPRAMARADLRPEELAALLPSIFLMDRSETPPLDIVFRLVGTAIVRVEGEITGRSLSELIPRADNPAVWEHYERALAGELCLRRETLRWQDRAYIHYDVLLLPMTRGATGSASEIDALLGMALYRFMEDGGLPPLSPVGPMA